ncbi:MAG: alkaline phosphatase family protein [Caulobacter sp.]|nr:alkaline phosphatase family protein [Caulobacter sp.]
MTLRRWSGALAGLPVLAAASLASLQPVWAAEPKPVPKLVVVISVDQFSANIFNQYRGRYTAGLRSLADQGLVYINGYQTHSGTETCPGHSTILTGKHPNKTGIPANDWLDPVTGKSVYCLSVPANTLAGGLTGGNGPVGPDNLKASTLGDWMKEAGTGGRVFAIAGKDRGAIAMAGHKADGVFWWREGFGFTTYVEPGQTDEQRLAPVKAINADLKARFEGKPATWDYQIAGQTWQSRLPPAKIQFDNTPLLDEVTVEGAIRLIDEQKLGAGQATDVLAVSLSATDRIGHGAGTQGPEMCEQQFRLDAAIGKLLAAARAVPGGAVVVLTADHGGSDFPERQAERGFPQAQRYDPEVLVQLNTALKAQFKLKTNPVIFDGSGLYVVDDRNVRLPEPLRSKIARAAVEWLSVKPGIAAVYTLDELLRVPLRPGVSPEEVTVKERAAMSAVAGRSPDVIVILEPGMSPLRARIGGALSTHGSPWDYDRRVPILFWWSGAQGQERFYPIETTDIGPTLAHLLNLTPPADVDGRCLDLGGFAVAACPKPAVAPPPAPEPKKAGFRWPWEKAQ